jgi:hypothetical protein
VHVVVNHLHLREPVTDTTVEAAREAVQLVVDGVGSPPGSRRSTKGT